MKELSAQIKEKNKAKCKFTADLPRRPKFSSDIMLFHKRSFSEIPKKFSVSAYTRLIKDNELYNESEYDLSYFGVKVAVRHKNTEVNLKRLRLKNLEFPNSNKKTPLDHSLY